MVVPLVPAAVAILKARLQAAAGNSWVFPTRSRTGHLTEPKAAWKRILKRAGLSHLRPHDLRRSLGSWQAAAGASLAIIGASLGHADLKSTQVYARLQLDPVRESVTKAGQAMIDACGVKTIEAESNAITDDTP